MGLRGLLERRAARAAVVCLGLAVTLTVTLTGCSGGDDAELHFADENLTTSSPVALTPEEQSLVDGAWVAFGELHRIYQQSAQTGSYAWNVDETRRPMYRYAGGRYMAALEHDLATMQEQGLVRTGEPTITLRRVVSVSATSLVVEACVDGAGTDTINKSTRKSVAVAGQNKKYPVTVRAGLYADGLWRWVDAVTTRSMSC
jgi:pectin methylesterase-like acyl-CoA thioesterase